MFLLNTVNDILNVSSFMIFGNGSINKGIIIFSLLFIITLP